MKLILFKLDNPALVSVCRKGKGEGEERPDQSQVKHATHGHVTDADLILTTQHPTLPAWTHEYLEYLESMCPAPLVTFAIA